MNRAGNIVPTPVFHPVTAGSEKVAAIAALGVLVPYYLVLFLLRDRIKKDFQFRIIE